jgi:ABC-type nitrate/sulfonate/bicarbonate transport system substrate-binding protein
MQTPCRRRTYDIASTAFDNVLAWSGREGAEIVAVAQISDRTVLPVFVRPEIKSWSDLKGKKLAADGRSGSRRLAVLFLKSARSKHPFFRVISLGTQARQFAATHAVKIEGVPLITGCHESPRSRLT